MERRARTGKFTEAIVFQIAVKANLALKLAIHIKAGIRLKPGLDVRIGIGLESNPRKSLKSLKPPERHLSNPVNVLIA
ncbi:MAG: hypothetical protein IPM92_08770 [Saprospiraceae bacterium]|nr:hypothetical protein [Saprospiraceae bacterium]